LGIGLCFALPLFLFLRDRKLHGQLTPAPKAEAQTPSTSPDSAVAALGRERDSVWMPGGVRTEIHLDGEETGGSFCLLVDEPPTGWALPTHLHSEESETIHIVEGEFEMITDGERSILGPGDTAHVPVGIEHSGANLGASPGRRIVIFSPAGMEELFRELGTHDPSQLVDAGIALAAATRFGWRFGEAG
jgi:quercetin dioxygenase-like cupin family protein